MVDRMSLFKKLEIRRDPEFGLCIELCSWDHMDYIEDVLCEHFDIEYDFKIDDPEILRYALFFDKSINESELKDSILSINHHHKSSGQIYVTS
ncbi:hypothetical protein BTJ40_12975 [Microbulbifer sp. A4B17]|nr:hypothetical protein BTJ40_12975 [Microbulbifer sp. A4B17]